MGKQAKKTLSTMSCVYLMKRNKFELRFSSSCSIACFTLLLNSVVPTKNNPYLHTKLVVSVVLKSILSINTTLTLASSKLNLI